MGIPMMISIGLWGAFIIYLANIYMKYIIKPEKNFKIKENNEILYSSSSLWIIGLIFIVLFIASDFYIVYKNDRQMFFGLLFALIILYSKPSSLVISEKKLYLKRQMLNYENIKKIELTQDKNYNIKLNDGSKYNVNASKKVIQSMKQFCEINNIEYKEDNQKEE